MYLFYNDGKIFGLEEMDSVQMAEKFIQEKIDAGGNQNLDNYVLIQGTVYEPKMIVNDEGDLKVKIPF